MNTVHIVGTVEKVGSQYAAEIEVDGQMIEGTFEDYSLEAELEVALGGPVRISSDLERAEIDQQIDVWDEEQIGDFRGCWTPGRTEYGGFDELWLDDDGFGPQWFMDGDEEFRSSIMSMVEDESLAPVLSMGEMLAWKRGMMLPAVVESITNAVMMTLEAVQADTESIVLNTVVEAVKNGLIEPEVAYSDAFDWLKKVKPVNARQAWELSEGCVDGYAFARWKNGEKPIR